MYSICVFSVRWNLVYVEWIVSGFNGGMVVSMVVQVVVNQVVKYRRSRFSLFD